MKKILCVCNHGNNRSGALARQLKMLGGDCNNRDEYIKKQVKFEPIAVGAHCFTDETLSMLIKWADIIVDLSDDGVLIPNLLDKDSKNKYIRFYIGGDIWGNPAHPDLHEKLKPIIEKLLK